MGKKIALHNLGCKVNAYEMDAMEQMLREGGYEIVPFAPGADIYLINTCTVTNVADKKSRQMLHRAKKLNPRAIVVAAGCYVQADRERVEADPAVDLVIGNNKKKELLTILAAFDGQRERKESVININQTREYEELSISRAGEHTRAYLKVQDGCNQFCTYCIIPYARGRVRSRKKESVLEEVRRLSQAGYREVVLTGIHLSSYGTDFPEGERESLLSLIEEIHQAEGIRRIRLGSLEPGIVTREFAAALAALPKVCPHFHLSLQSGCDRTLERMNRRYRSGEYQEKCALLREYFSNPALTTDVIVGFPGETEEDFRLSYDFVKEIGFYETHVFKYSRREGTKAAAMKEQIPEPVKASRSEKMIAFGEGAAKAYREGFLDREVEILLEESYTDARGSRWMIGHTPEYVKAALPFGTGRPGEMARGRVRGFLEDEILECR